MIGQTLGPYQIVDKLGEGGMGVVYRARDARVGRDVAIKVSAEHFSDRFEREARAVAALNHPNICSLYDLGPNYLVMELVEGEPLQGPLPYETALDYARQIGLALEAAHEKGIVHRDLKPANIRVRNDGTVKVLDFGLAKIGMDEASPVNPANSPTMTLKGTHAGMILGTAAYMAPEQARGKTVDKRADIWAFGVVFYEMLTGRRAFDGEDVSSIVAAVIQSEPRWEGVPPGVRRLLESCLEKDPRKRLRDIGDAWKLLDDAPRPAASASRSGRMGWVAAAAFAGAAALALWAPWRTTPRDAARPLVRLDVDLGDVSLVPLTAPTFSSLTISPDGTRLVFVGVVPGGTPKLFSRRLDESAATELAGTDGASNPFFSPDGQWVAFWTGVRVAKVPSSGGAVVPLADIKTMTGGSWVDDDNLIVASGRPDTAGLVRIPAGGGTPVPVRNLAENELFYNYPHVLPGSKAVLASIVNRPPGTDSITIDSINVEIVSLVDGRRKAIMPRATSPRYLPSGHVMYAARAGVFAVPFDIETWETRGPGVPILADALFDPVTAGAHFSVSGSTLVYRKQSDDTASARQLLWLDPAGRQEALLAKPGAYIERPKLSPDGGRVALVVRDGIHNDVWIYEPQRDNMKRLTSGVRALGLVWSRDGRYVIFGTLGGGLRWARADGAGEPQLLIDTKNFQFPRSLSPDGTRLAFEQVDGTPQIWTVELMEEQGRLKAGMPERFLTTPYQDAAPAFSPDGRWIAYHSNKGGRFEVYVRPFSTSPSGQESVVQISNSGGLGAAWSPNGRDLLYASGTRIMAVSYTVRNGVFLADKERVWAANTAGIMGFDIAPDGRIAINLPAAPRETLRPDRTIVYLENFLDELRRRAPSSR